MCHYCHTLKKNLQAPQHRSSKCCDKANTFSKVPMEKRRYDNGKPIRQSHSTTDSCVICWDQAKNMTFIPCGHIATCESCSSQLNDCPICRQPIANKQKVFFA